MTEELDTQFDYTCNICGTPGSASLSQLDREVASCEGCFSTPRFRSVIHALSCELFGVSLAIDDFPHRFDLQGMGLSDWDGYSDRLASRLSYRNSFLHKPPVLDIVEGAHELEDSLDFVIASEVFEHVDPPVSTAMRTVVRLLKPGGTFILTVPYGDGAFTHEHFPTLHEYSIEGEGEHTTLRNVRPDGSVEVFEDLRFHGGPGSTLEMRFFARRALMLELLTAGFDSLSFYGPVRSRGIYWEESDWGLPIAARAPAA
jgi:SAM-dependent methyltransferase